ncbi:microphthalmia-associated transcription factor [Phialemonium atrogriseum]|uniref:Microphthalmia-associated transcription factor n=1 Tax=Phialemonium atrogriseum TaxID=1093897 RepID=A0AAJ0C3H1_9PEZI|nr:microphthalmia-associated transcription factor [Phialemonium atrogriseum]KAK1769464.1 microphthalmia-associated transcription factor [Phialemonium atrogriseum]
MAQHGFQIGGGHGASSIDPNDLTMSGNYPSPYQSNFNSNHSNPSNGFSSGSALFGDDELLDGLPSPTEAQSGMQGHGQEFGGMNDINIGYAQGIYNSHHSLPVEQSHINGYSNTPDGDPIQSPFVHSGFGPYRPMPQSFGGSLQSPISYGGSPLANSELNNDGGDPNYLKARARMSQTMQRKPPTARSPLTPKAAAMAGLSMNSPDSYGAQPIRTGGQHHEKSHSGQWVQTPNSLSSFPGSGFSSPLAAGLHSAQINDIMIKGGTSMPAKLGATSSAVSSQEAKRKRRRESHNMVERRRRDNINERIQDLSKLVPAHRLEDEKVRKAIQNGTPLSPTLQGVANPSQATSGLAGPGARRATSGAAGNITTGLPIDDKDKGPNKGDILNGAVSWTRDLMWMLHLKIQQQEELLNCIVELGGHVPLELTDDERRMQTELLEAITKNEENTKADTFSYSRTAGSGLRVPHHTNYKGEPLNGSNNGIDHVSGSPDDDVAGAVGSDMLDSGEFLDYDDDGSGDMNFKEEDEYGMDLN